MTGVISVRLLSVLEPKTICATLQAASPRFAVSVPFCVLLSAAVGSTKVKASTTSSAFACGRPSEATKSLTPVADAGRPLIEGEACVTAIAYRVVTCRMKGSKRDRKDFIYAVAQSVRRSNMVH
jgi:hypothetical protein